jgi:hypothetical protein
MKKSKLSSRFSCLFFFFSVNAQIQALFNSANLLERWKDTTSLEVLWSPYKPMYVLPYDGQPTLMRGQIRKFRSDYTPAGVDYNIEAKFQLSFKTASGAW